MWALPALAAPGLRSQFGQTRDRLGCEANLRLRELARRVRDARRRRRGPRAPAPPRRASRARRRGSPPRLRLVEVERDHRAGAALGAVLEPDARVPATHQLARDRQPKAGPGRPRPRPARPRWKRSKTCSSSPGARPGPAVHDLQPPRARLDPHGRSGGRIAERVLDERRRARGRRPRARPARGRPRRSRARAR